MSCYLNDWEKAVNEREGFSKDERKRMILSQETPDGLRMTGMYITLWLWYTSVSVSLWICGNGTIFTPPERVVMSFIITLQSRSSGIIFWSAKGSGRKV